MIISKENIENARNRFRAKIESGFYNADDQGRVLRSDGSYTTEQTYVESTLAEKFAADFLGCPFNDEVYEYGGDGGVDFMLSTTKGEKEVEVIWLGFYKGTTNARKPEHGNLIVNPYQKARWADIYVVICGSINDGFRFAGWSTHKILTSFPKKEFTHNGKTIAKFAQHCSDLLPYDKLVPYLKK